VEGYGKPVQNCTDCHELKGDFHTPSCLDCHDQNWE
jgi:hypothetical protein